jgi:hypothetical protein
VRDENRLVALVDDLRQRGIEEKRHVVVDDLEHRHVPAAPVALDLQVDEAQVRPAPGARRLQVLERRPGEIRERAGGIGGEILRRNPPEQVDHEGGGHRRPDLFEHGRRLGGQRASGRRHVELHAVPTSVGGETVGPDVRPLQPWSKLPEGSAEEMSR